MLDAVFFAYFGCTQNFHSFDAVSRSAHQDSRSHQLGIVLVGGEHSDLEAGFCGSYGHGSDDIVGFEARHFEDGDVVGADDVLDDGNRASYVFGCAFALCFIFRVFFVSESGAGRIESNAYVIGFFVAKHILERIDKSEDGRGVFAS